MAYTTKRSRLRRLWRRRRQCLVDLRGTKHGELIVVFRSHGPIPQRVVRLLYLSKLILYETLNRLISTRSFIGMELHCQMAKGCLDFIGFRCWRNT